MSCVDSDKCLYGIFPIVYFLLCPMSNLRNAHVACPMIFMFLVVLVALNYSC